MLVVVLELEALVLEALVLEALVLDVLEALLDAVVLELVVLVLDVLVLEALVEAPLDVGVPLDVVGPFAGLAVLTVRFPPAPVVSRKSRSFPWAQAAIATATMTGPLTINHRPFEPSTRICDLLCRRSGLQRHLRTRRRCLSPREPRDARREVGCA